MGGKSSPPPSPDYASLIPLQEQSNINQFNTMLGASRVNSVTPFGTQSWIPPSGWGQQPTPQTPQTPTQQTPTQQTPNISQGPSAIEDWVPFGGAGQTETNTQGGGGGFQGIPNVYGGAAGSDPWTFVQQLSPEQQALYNQDLRIRGGQGAIAEGMMGNVAQTYMNPANFAQNLPGYNYIGGQQWRGPNYRSNMGSREDAEQAIMNRQLRYMVPDYAGRESQLHDRLTAQGFNVNDPGYRQAMDQFQAQRDRAMADVRDQAILGGGQEATSELARAMSAAQGAFGAGMQNRQFLSGQQQTALQYALQQMQAQERDRARQLNELNAFRTGQQVQLPSTPGQTSVPNLQGIDQLGMANQDYQNQLSAWNANQAAGGNFMSGLFGLGGALLGAPAGSFGAKLFGG